MLVDAPDAERVAWKAFARSDELAAEEPVEAVATLISAMLLSPHFLLAH
jgi:hypothetical protein